MIIRRAEPKDHDNIWALVEPVFRAGETYPVPRDISPEDGLAYWLAPEKTLFVAEDENKLVGLYYIKPNTGGGGSHICNCGYITSKAHRRKGIAKNSARTLWLLPRKADIVACNIIWSFRQISRQSIFGKKWDLK